MVHPARLGLPAPVVMTAPLLGQADSILDPQADGARGSSMLHIADILPMRQVLEVRRVSA